MSLSGNGIIGIRREDKSKWERRSPLTPHHVQLLLQQHKQHNRRILLQPSTRRIFTDAEFQAAGAEITEDLTPCGTILAVKEVPISFIRTHPNRSYMFFSHTIKAQAANMPLLDTVVENHVRLFDYEAITEGGKRGAPRKVAFGKFAGIAGMIDFFRGLGARLLSLGYSTPFLHIASMYQYENLVQARAAVARAGAHIREYGLPPASIVSPLTIVVTGEGRVAQGACEVIQWLNGASIGNNNNNNNYNNNDEKENAVVKMVHPFELKDIVATATGTEKTHKVYCAIANASHMVRARSKPMKKSTSASLVSASERLRSDGISGVLSPSSVANKGALGGSSSSPFFATQATTTTPPTTPTVIQLLANSTTGTGASLTIPLDIDVDESAFEKEAYKARPETFEPIFHIKVAPYASCIVNCMYWESKFPRLLTTAQTQYLQAAGRLRLLGVEDISCDLPDGSIEFIKEPTSIEDPFAMYDPEQDIILRHTMDVPGIFYQAVDHLPSECPQAASEWFSECLSSYVGMIAFHKESGVGEVGAGHVSSLSSSSSSLPPELTGAILCEKGALTPNFDYIARLREAAAKAEAGRGLRRSRNESFITLRLHGHLFDSQIVNRVLDAVEDNGASAQILDFRVGRDRATPTTMRLQIFAAVNPERGGVVQQEQGPRKMKGEAAALITLLDTLRQITSPTGATLTIEQGGGEEEDVKEVLLSFGRSGSGSGSGSGTVADNNVEKAGLKTTLEVPTTTTTTTHLASTVSTTSTTSAATISFLSMLPPDSPRQPSPRRILVLGAGYVSGPVIEYLLRRPGNTITVGANIKQEAEALAKGHLHRVIPVILDVGKLITDSGGANNNNTNNENNNENLALLSKLIQENDVIISLVPAFMHVGIAKLAVQYKRNMVTASYISPGMKALQQQACDANIILLNECGLDPGIDHMSAAKVLDTIRHKNGHITSFVSVCGGLPAPEATNDNLLGYKFSWSPRGALSAMKNPARYLQDGKEVKVEWQDLLTSARKFVINPAFSLEVLPNRDSLPYAAEYGMEMTSADGASTPLRTMFRGTLRYAGFAVRMSILAKLGFLNDNSAIGGGNQMKIPGNSIPRELLYESVFGATSLAADTTRSLSPDAIEAKTNDFALARAAGEVTGVLVKKTKNGNDASDESSSNVISSASSDTSKMTVQEVYDFLMWIGLLSRVSLEAIIASRSVGTAIATTTTTSAPSTTLVYDSPLDATVALLLAKPEMSYAPGERDMAILQHTVHASYPDGRVEKTTATLLEYAKVLDGHSVTSLSSLVSGVSSGNGVHSGAGGSSSGSVSTISSSSSSTSSTSALLHRTPPTTTRVVTAMARTVGLTTAIAAQMILDGRVTHKGVLAPTTRELYGPILEALEDEGIVVHEKIEVVA